MKNMKNEEFGNKKSKELRVIKFKNSCISDSGNRAFFNLEI